MKKLEDLEKDIEEAKRRRNSLLKVKEVKEYIDVDSKLDQYLEEYRELYQDEIIKKCSCCKHLFVISGSTYDTCEGRTYYYYGCLKCGLDTLYKEEYTTLEQKAYHKYIRNNWSVAYSSSGIGYSDHDEFVKGMEMYAQIKSENDELTDEEIIEIMKIKRDVESRIRKKKLENRK